MPIESLNHEKIIATSMQGKLKLSTGPILTFNTGSKIVGITCAKSDDLDKIIDFLTKNGIEFRKNKNNRSVITLTLATFEEFNKKYLKPAPQMASDEGPEMGKKLSLAALNFALHPQIPGTGFHKAQNKTRANGSTFQLTPEQKSQNFTAFGGTMPSFPVQGTVFAIEIKETPYLLFDTDENKLRARLYSTPKPTVTQAIQCIVDTNEVLPERPVIITPPATKEFAEALHTIKAAEVGDYAIQKFISDGTQTPEMKKFLAENPNFSLLLNGKSIGDQRALMKQIVDSAPQIATANKVKVRFDRNNTLLANPRELVLVDGCMPRLGSSDSDSADLAAYRSGGKLNTQKLQNTYRVSLITQMEAARAAGCGGLVINPPSAFIKGLPEAEQVQARIAWIRAAKEAAINAAPTALIINLSEEQLNELSKEDPALYKEIIDPNGPVKLQRSIEPTIADSAEVASKHNYAFALGGHPTQPFGNGSGSNFRGNTGEESQARTAPGLKRAAKEARPRFVMNQVSTAAPTSKQRVDASVNVSGALENCFFHSYALHLMGHQQVPAELFNFQSILGPNSPASQLQQTFSSEEQLSVFNEISGSSGVVEKTFVLGVLLREYLATKMATDPLVKKDISQKAQAEYERYMDARGVGFAHSDIAGSGQYFIANKANSGFLNYAFQRQQALESDPTLTTFQKDNNFEQYFQGTPTPTSAQAFQQYWAKEGHLYYCKNFATSNNPLSIKDVAPIMNALGQPVHVYGSDGSLSPDMTTDPAGATKPAMELALDGIGGHYHILRQVKTSAMLDAYERDIVAYNAEKQASSGAKPPLGAITRVGGGLTAMLAEVQSIAGAKKATAKSAPTPSPQKGTLTFIDSNSPPPKRALIVGAGTVTLTNVDNMGFGFAKFKGFFSNTMNQWRVALEKHLKDFAKGTPLPPFIPLDQAINADGCVGAVATVPSLADGIGLMRGYSKPPSAAQMQELEKQYKSAVVGAVAEAKRLGRPLYLQPLGIGAYGWAPKKAAQLTAEAIRAADPNKEVSITVPLYQGLTLQNNRDFHNELTRILQQDRTIAPLPTAAAQPEQAPEKTSVPPIDQGLGEIIAQLAGAKTKPSIHQKGTDYLITFKDSKEAQKFAEWMKTHSINSKIITEDSELRGTPVYRVSLNQKNFAELQKRVQPFLVQPAAKPITKPPLAKQTAAGARPSTAPVPPKRPQMPKDVPLDQQLAQVNKDFIALQKTIATPDPNVIEKIEKLLKEAENNMNKGALGGVQEAINLSRSVIRLYKTKQVDSEIVKDYQEAERHIVQAPKSGMSTALQGVAKVGTGLAALALVGAGIALACTGFGLIALGIGFAAAMIMQAATIKAMNPEMSAGQIWKEYTKNGFGPIGFIQNVLSNALFRPLKALGSGIGDIVTGISERRSQSKLKDAMSELREHVRQDAAKPGTFDESLLQSTPDDPAEFAPRKGGP